MRSLNHFISLALPFSMIFSLTAANHVMASPSQNMAIEKPAILPAVSDDGGNDFIGGYIPIEGEDTATAVDGVLHGGCPRG